MLKKFLLFLFILISVLPVYSGEFEDVSAANRKVLLYLYTSQCTYCEKFAPIYDKIREKYSKSCKFVKIDANTQYGNSLVRAFNAGYVPYVVLVDNYKRTVQRVTPTCLLNYACIQDAMDGFVK